MFENWGFLLSEIWVLLIIAALVGLLAGWIIWGRRTTETITETIKVTDSTVSDRLRAELDACGTERARQAERITALEKELTAAQAALAKPALAAVVAPAPVRTEATKVEPKPAAAKPTASKTKPAAAAKQPAKLATKPAAATEPAPAPAAPQKPAGLKAARAGKADDLKLIKGIGPVLEKLCHRLGYFHFDQIANWTASEVAWVDDNLEGFKGRVTRDEWVVQARDLAAGKPPRACGEK